MRSSDSASGNWSLRNEITLSKRDMRARVCCSIVFTTAKTQRQPKWPPADQRIKKMWYIHKVDYHSAIKKEILPSADTAGPWVPYAK